MPTRSSSDLRKRLQFQGWRSAGIRRYSTTDLFPLALSISGDPSRRADVVRMATFLNKHLNALGVVTKLVDLGPDNSVGKDLPLPPAILGKIGTDPSKKTVLVYGHYDVQPVRISAPFLALCSGRHHDDVISLRLLTVCPCSGREK
jgi:acetylornithine deacetylase/succinyl-diaminopimelate desuccinylase-like protein